MVLRLALVFLVAGGGLASASAQTPASGDRGSAAAQAYYEFMLARHLETQNDTAGALAALKRALELDPKSAELHAELAGFYARQNNGPESVAAAERALALDADNVEARRMLGLVYGAWSEGGAPAGRSPAELRTQAIEHLTRILQTPAVATDLNLQLTLARLLMRNGDAARAVPILENVVSQAPFATEPYTMLADARLGLGRIDAAIEAMEAAAELNPRHYAALGDLYERQRRWDDAVGAYEQAVAAARGPAGRDVRLRYAAALLNTGEAPNATKARDVLKDALMTAPEDPRGLFLLSAANLRLGDPKGAEAVARQLVALDPANLAGLRALSGALIAQGEYRKVIEVLAPLSADVRTRAKGREGEAALLLAQLAQAHTEVGEHEQAVSALTAAVAADPLSGPALNSLGYTLAERGERLAEAVGFIERALKVEPGNPSYIDSLGWALLKQGRLEEAEPYLRQAAEALPKNSVILDHYGDVLAGRQKYREAVAAWERALEGDGQDVDRAVIEKKIRDARARQQ